MGVDAMRISVKIGRFLGISITKCYKLVCKHPFLVGVACFLIFLYRSFPFLFSLLVSASPVLVCTAVLLGILLSFGEPNIPEIEKEKEEEEEVIQEISSLKRGVVGDSTIVFEKDKDFFIESFVGKRKDTTEEGIGEERWEENRVSKIGGDGDFGDLVPLIDEGSREIQLVKHVTEVERDFDVSKLVKKGEILEEREGIEEVLDNGKVVDTLQVEDPKSTGESVQTHIDGPVDSQDLPWRRVNDDDEEDEDEEASDSGSDGAESSSPDASMADIIPMLDELHPLLNAEAPQQANMSDDGSDAGSEESHKADGEDGDDDDDNEEEEEVQGSKDDDGKSAIKWTEDDQKNLLDLGTSELERNQRLESLIARRRARQSMKLMPEKNLIDLDGADIPFNIPHITTTRRNPFDHPFDSYDDVPGSAPSVLLPGHNPFDLPYDSSEEKPDLKGDSFQQEFSPFQHREAIFRRHESFNVGPSVLGGPKQGRQDLRWKPYFVPERFGTEETSYHTFQRQLSEASESKVSSVPDTESISSAMEDKLNQEDVIQETDMISNGDHASVLVERGSLSSEDVDALDIEHEGSNVDQGSADIALGDGENHHEDSSLPTSEGATPVGVNTSEILLRMEPGEDEYSSRSSISSLSEIDETISDVKKGSMHPEPSNGEVEESQISTQTSLDSDFHFVSEVADENQQRKPDLEPIGNRAAESVTLIQRSSDSDFHFTKDVEDENRHVDAVLEPAGNHTGGSGISMQASLDSGSRFTNEVVDNDQHKEHVLEPRGNGIEESGISTQFSLDSDSHFTNGGAHDNQQKEPVYDSSPQPAEKLISFLSISSDIQGQTPEISLPPVFASHAGKESDVNSESLKEDGSPYRETHEHFTEEFSLDENELRSRETTEIEHDVIVGGLSEDDRTYDGQNGKDVFMTPKSGIEHDTIDFPVFLSNEGSVNKGLVYKGKSSNYDVDQQDLLIPNAEITVEPRSDVIEKLKSAPCISQVASGETVLHAPEEQLPVHVSRDSNLSSSETETVKEHATDVEGALQPERDQVPSSSGDAEIEVNSHQALGHHEKCLEPSTSLAESTEEASITNDETSEPSSVLPESLVYKSQVDEVDFKDCILDKIAYEDRGHISECPAYSAERDGPPVAEENSNEDEDVIKEIDEGLLSELDTVGDFRVKEVVGESLNDKQFQSSNFDLLLRDSSDEGFTFPSEIGDQPISESRGTRETDIDLQVVDARPLEDTNVAMVQASDDNIKEMPELSDIEEERTKGNEVGSSTSAGELPVLEMRTANDIDLVFKQLGEGVDVEEVIVPSTIEQHAIANESGDPQQTSSDMQVVEARSLEDLQIVMKQAVEDHVKEMPKSSDRNEETVSSTSEATEVRFTKFTVVATEEGLIQKTESNSKESGDEETQKETPEEPKNGLLKYFGF